MGLLAEVVAELAGPVVGVTDRLRGTLVAWESGAAGAADVAVLLRQAIRATHRRLPLPQALWEEIQDLPCGLRATAVQPGWVEVEAVAWQPDWLPDAAQMDALERRRCDPAVAGDGVLQAMSGWNHYQSQAQQVAVHTALFAGKGATTLVTLPTGAGKSLAILLPAWYESNGGRRRGGTTLVIVPTVSLAIDQERQAQRYFADARGPAYRPLCLIGEMDRAQRDLVRQGLQEGTLPLLYLAPEALLNSSLQAICLTAARQGQVTRLVLDEAHLVESWGAGFRTAFQFLAAYRKQLLAASGDALRTLLLSATLGAQGEALLRALFGEPGPFHQVRANRLRPEPGYWFHQAPGRPARQARVVEALHHLPRPALLYVTRPDEAEAWVGRLQQQGFRRLAAFTGATPGAQRRDLVRRWAANEIDLMVATSAFGLGVDKGDVRTVIHAALPENIDRYYQEVGRGGRDGWSSISLVCTVAADQAAARRMTVNARITADKAVLRWASLRAAAQPSPSGHRNEWLFDTGTRPQYNPEMWAGRRNEEWNEHVLLLMQRAGLIEVTENRAGIEALAAAQEDGYSPTWRHVRLLDAARLNDPASLRAHLEATRQAERAALVATLQHMGLLVTSYASPPEVDTCLSYELAEVYPATARACGSCAVCRERGKPPFAAPLPLKVSLGTMGTSQAFLDGDLQPLFQGRGVVHASWDGERAPDRMQRFQRLLIDLVGRGFQQLVLPTSLVVNSAWLDHLVEQLRQHRTIPHRLLVEAALVQHPAVPLFPLPTVVLYPERDEAADHLHQALAAQATALPARVNIVHTALHLASQHGTFRQRVDGLWLTTQALELQVAPPATFDYF